MLLNLRFVISKLILINFSKVQSSLIETFLLGSKSFPELSDFELPRPLASSLARGVARSDREDFRNQQRSEEGYRIDNEAKYIGYYGIVHAGGEIADSTAVESASENGLTVAKHGSSGVDPKESDDRSSE
jgi:hypothetical protein